ncbi:MAG: spore germination protein [Clostridia bacterium]|nr:spore germination protein [Clostridia bacterium]
MNDYDGLLVDESLEKNIELFKEIFKKDELLRIRVVNVGESKTKIAFLFFDGMVEGSSIDDSLVRPCVTSKDTPRQVDIDYILARVLYAGELSKTKKVSDILRAMLNGDTAVFLDGSFDALTVDTKGWRTRGIDEPSDERVLQGPREGFDEAAILNLAMIRRKLQTPDLCINSTTLGRRTKTAVYFVYLDSVANKKCLEEIKKRMEKIDIDGILDSNYIAELVRDNKTSLFKTTGSTERPDIVAARLLEGRIAVVVDGTPVVLTVPYLFSENFQSDEDYYLNFYIASIGRALRYICFFLSISIPAIFIALSTFHIQLLPTPFMLTVSELRSGVPFSSITECLALILVFEILKETGLRTPQSLGSALSIVGGLVVGQTAVEARIMSAPMLIVVSLAAVAGLMIPRLKGAVFYLRIILAIASAILGLYGFMIVFAVFVISVLSMKSVGVEYMLSLKSPNFQALKDTVIRAPWTKMRLRPPFNRNLVRNRSKK